MIFSEFELVIVSIVSLNAQNILGVIKLEDAVAVVQKEIRDLRTKYESVAKMEEQNPIMIEGETSTGYYCQLMADLKDVAKILLEYDYPVWRVLDEDAPRAMWEDLGRELGLEHVCSVDL